MNQRTRSDLLRRVVTWSASVLLAFSLSALALSGARHAVEPFDIDVGMNYGCLVVHNWEKIHRSNGEYWEAADTTCGWLGPGPAGFLVLDGKRWAVVLPLWMPAVATGAVLARIWFLRKRTRVRAVAGQCLICGYELTGMDGMCPECGHKQESKA